MARLTLGWLTLLLAACSVGQQQAETTTSATPEDAVPVADVRAVTVTGSDGAYTFAVEVASPDTGCDQYADWWEVVTEDGTLLYRRILTHSHINEQPFVRSGGPVDVAADAIVLVRAHLHPTGYGGQVLRGSATTGFTIVEGEVSVPAEVETAAPQPDGCRF